MKNLWVPISGAVAQQKKVDTIANNVANANTPGFKRDTVTFKEHLTAYEKGADIDLPNKEWAPEDFYRSYGAEDAKVKVDGMYTVHEQGQLSPTGNPLDFGIHGPAFFEVLTPNGVRYTRRGNFSLSSEGHLVTDQGFKVLSQVDLEQNPEDIPSPEERVITIKGGKPVLNLEGDIFVKGEKVASLGVVEFQDQNALRKEGNSLFINPHQDNIKNAKESRVHQGFVEQSNVNPVHEMSELIKANRHFESIQRVIKAYDSISAKAINEIPKF